MHLVQILLPTADNDGRPFGRELFDRVRAELTERHGGVTAFLRSPAKGLWKAEDGRVASDEVVTVEVMVPTLDRAEWASYREGLKTRFRQEELVVRAIAIEPL